MDKKYIFQEYTRIMKNEIKLKPRPLYRWLQQIIMNPKFIYGQTMQIAEIAKSSLLSRCYNKYYNLDEHDIVFESVGSHANLFSAIVDRALIFIYGPDFGSPNAECPYTIDGHTYREIMEAIRLHDLPENEIGDWPDNGNQEKDKKAKLEQAFFQDFSKLHHDSVKNSNANINALKLVESMDDYSHPTNRLLKIADKTTALFMALHLDSIGKPPIMHKNSPEASRRDIIEMTLCDFCENNCCKASEMWAIDYFKIRRFNELDDSGFFIAIIIMYTLCVKNQWYTWREKDYFS